MTANLAAALVAVQAAMPTVAKGNNATVPMKTGGQYSYTYADLGDVSRAILPLLVANGLAFTCLGRLTPNGYELAGTLLHVSGESIEGALPITGRTPQEIGSAITYARRYLLGAMTGIVTDEDDDGGIATAAVHAQEAEQRAREQAARDVETARSELRAWANRAGFDLRNVAEVFAERHPNRPPLGKETEPEIVRRFTAELRTEHDAKEQTP